MPNFFSYYFLLWSIPTLQLYIFILRKANTMPKKIMGAKKFYNYIIYYADSLRHYWTAEHYIYILLYSSSLSSSLILYYTHETRTRIYYYYYISLFFFAFFFSYSILFSLLCFIPMHSQH